MKLSERIKTYNFWVSLSSAIFLTIKVLGNQIGFNVDESLFSDLITSICSILVILGIIVPPKSFEIKSKLESETISQTEKKVLTQSEEKNNELYSSSQIIDNEKDIFTENKIESLKLGETETKLLECSATEIIDENNLIVSSNEIIESDIIDVDLESANINIENIDNINQPTTYQNTINSIKTNFQTVLTSQKNLFNDNIEEYIKILENELKSLKNK